MNEQQTSSGRLPPTTSSPSSPPSPHWSESFVEHLRTVHFAVTILAMAMIFTLVSGKAYSVQKAWTEATEIRDLSVDWEQRMSRLFDDVSSRASIPEYAQFTAQKRYFTQDKHKFFRVKDSRYFTITKENLMSLEQWQKIAGLQQRPATVAAFRSWWDQLQRGVDIPIPGVDYLDENGGYSPPTGCRLLDPRLPWIVPWGPSRLGASEDCFVAEVPAANPHDDSQFQDVTCRELSGTDKKDVDSCSFRVRGLDPDRTLFAFAVIAPVEHFNENGLKALYADWGTGKFDTAFSDLRQATLGSLEYIDLKSLPDRLNEGSRADQVIEAFGLKIAAADITRWGLLILLATQFYFWLHVHELTRRIEPSDPGWKVAWIGIYPQRLALITVLTSACILPLIASSLAAYNLRFDGHPFLQRSVAALAVAISAYLAVSTGHRLNELRTELSSKSMDPASTSTIVRTHSEDTHAKFPDSNGLD